MSGIEMSAELPPTEQRLDASLDLDERSSLEVLQLLNREDRVAVDALVVPARP